MGQANVFSRLLLPSLKPKKSISFLLFATRGRNSYPLAAAGTVGHHQREGLVQIIKRCPGGKYFAAPVLEFFSLFLSVS